MADELVRVRIKLGNKVRLTNMGRTLAEASDNVEVLDGEPTHKGDGTTLATTFESGRPLKPTTSVADEAAKKTAAKPAEATEAVTESADTQKENQ